MQLTDSQAKAIGIIDRDLCVEAGAGAGKTFVLIERIVHLLEKGVPLDRIVAITFTEAAAKEMKDRLRTACHKRANQPDIHRDEMSRWRDRERQVEMARISTIHSFCGAVLRENALSLGQDPDFAVLTEAESTLTRRDVVRDRLHELLDAGDADALYAVAQMRFSPLSGALTALLGKRGVMDRLAVPMGDVEGLLGEWRRGIEENGRNCVDAIRAEGEAWRLLTELRRYDGTCTKPQDAREVKRLETIKTLEVLFEATASASAVAATLSSLANALKGRGSKKSWQAPETCGAIGGLIDEVKKWAKGWKLPEIDGELESEAARLSVAVYRLFLEVAQAYDAAKAERNGKDFEDMISDALRILKDHADVRARLARGMDHLLIDEFQDTDAVQFEIAQLLRQEEDAPVLFIVGDAKQSIYRFRGTEVELFFEARESIEEEPVAMRDNFRTLPDVMAFINDFFAQSGLLEAVEREYHPMAPYRKGLGETRIEFLVPPEPEEEGKVPVSEWRRIEAEMLADRLMAMVEGETAVNVFDDKRDCARPARYGDMALLFRSRSNLYIYEESLRKRGIPYNVVGGRGFFSLQEYTDLRNLLAVIADPCDDMALLGFLRGPLAAFSDEMLMRLPVEHGALSEYFWSQNQPETETEARALAEARTLVADILVQADRPVGEVIRYMLDRTGYEAILLDQSLGLQRAGNVRKLIDLADGFASVRPPRLTDFVRYLDQLHDRNVAESEAALEAGESAAAVLMTIHGAKGLEFPIVALPDMSNQGGDNASEPIRVDSQLGFAVRVTGPDGNTYNPGVIELMKQQDKGKGEAEDARILYVAMTRARDWLLISGPPKASGFLAHLDKVYAILERPDEDVIAGVGWSARVRRAIPPSAVTVPEAVSTERTLSGDALLERVAPVLSRAPGRRTFSVTELLNVMHFDGQDSVDGSGANAGRGLAARRGTIVHRYFEQWDFERNEGPDVSAFLDGEQVPRELLDRLIEELPGLAQRFTRSDTARRMKETGIVQTEAPFLLRIDDAIVRGAIDVLLADGTVVDYKTGLHSETGQQRYALQLYLYAATVRRLNGSAAPRGLLYYIDHNETVCVECGETKVAEAIERARGAISRLKTGLKTR